MSGMVAMLVRRSQSDLAIWFWFVFGALSIENLIVIGWSLSQNGAHSADGKITFTALGIYSLSILSSAAATCAAGFLGFLFGIPLSEKHETVAASQRVEQSGQAPTVRVNTSLESISDGLTKILLGLSLAQFDKVGGWLRIAIEKLGPCLGPEPNGDVAALSVLVYGMVFGFIAGYLGTRILLPKVLGSGQPRQISSTGLPDTAPGSEPRKPETHA